MKIPKLIYLCGLILLLASCERSGIGAEPQIQAPLLALNYDGPVQTSPFLPGGEYEAAARFYANDLTAERNGNLIGLYFYLYNRPASCTIKIYKGSIGNGPDQLVYSAAVSSELTANSWNYHTISSPVKIENDDYWLAVKFSHTNQTQTIGCDQGPAHPEGDWLRSAADLTWQTFRSRTNNEASINWNIRGVVEP